ncbi:hypothetical protein AB6A40_010654 [Gnathostoma spinigerum]|uniref:Uncharacterized protein n=1 Tax=Gnathostoma spinigerum TaxID=75299 RepID=A0ABD6EVF8_9BILA
MITSRQALKSLGEIVSLCFTPFSTEMRAGHSRRLMSVEHPVFDSFNSLMYCLLMPCSASAVSTALSSTFIEGLLIVYECEVFSRRFQQLTQSENMVHCAEIHAKSWLLVWFLFI